MTFTELRASARNEFHITSKQFDSPKDYTFEDFEHDMIMDSLKIVNLNQKSSWENDVISAYSIAIEDGLRAMRDGTDSDNSNILITLVSEYLKKKAH